MPVLVSDRDAEDPLFGQHDRAIGARQRLALVGRHLIGPLRRRRSARAIDEMRDFIAMIAVQQGPGWNAQPISKRTALEVPPGRSLERDGAPPPFLNPQNQELTFPLVCRNEPRSLISLLNTAKEQPGTLPPPRKS
jgi:hypothetical protein